MRTLPFFILALTLNGCYAAMHEPDEHLPPAPTAAPASPTPRPTATPRRVSTDLVIQPLPGGLDDEEVFNSNCPEIVQESGILLSTLPQRAPGDASVYLDHPFHGRFGVFTHHLTKEQTPVDRVLYVGLLATNAAGVPVKLELARGATYLSQPDAPFINLPAIAPDPQGQLYAGPGDRVVTELLHDRSSVAATAWTLPAHHTDLVYSLPVPANGMGDVPANGRSTWLQMEAGGPVYLSELALFVNKEADGAFTPPTLADYMRVLNRKVTAGHREPPASYYDPAGKPPEGFRYGRVCGVSRGSTWRGTLSAPQPGERIGLPIASLYLNRLGTKQSQSAPMIVRYGDTARESQGNYGVTYELAMPISNPDPRPRRYSFTLSNPAKVEGDAGTPRRKVTYLQPPGATAFFRGTLRLDWTDERGAQQTRFSHLVLHPGEDASPFETIVLAPGKSTRAVLRLQYPPDATPPQLLTVGCDR